MLRKVEKIIKRSKSWAEFHSSRLEEEMFHDKRWLENNSFSTSHQSVNVYGLPEKRYEVRSEDAAVDIQIHREIKNPNPKTSAYAEPDRCEAGYNDTQISVSNEPHTQIHSTSSLSYIHQQAISIIKQFVQSEADRINLKVLKKNLDISTNEAKQLVHELEEIGLLVRVANPNLRERLANRNAIYIQLTKEGLNL